MPLGEEAASEEGGVKGEEKKAFGLVSFLTAQGSDLLLPSATELKGKL
jgi:hypothetical protein